MIGYITYQKKEKKKNIDTLYRLQKNNFCEGALKDKIYPESKDASVFTLLSSKGEEGPCTWNLRFICDFHDWELELLDSVMDLLYSKFPFIGATYCMKWVLMVMVSSVSTLIMNVYEVLVENPILMEEYFG